MNYRNSPKKEIRSRNKDSYLRISISAVAIQVISVFIVVCICTVFVSSCAGLSPVSAIEVDQSIESKSIESEPSMIVVENDAFKTLSNDSWELEPTLLTTPDVVDVEYETGTVIATVNIREMPSTDSTILHTASSGTEIKYYDYNDKWYQVIFEDDVAFAYKDYIYPGKIDYRSIRVSSAGFKSYMDYSTITAKSSPQYKIQHNFAYTDGNGLRLANQRYCIALGSAVNTKIGQYVDVVLANGTVINCIYADQKADIHTNADNLTTTANGCVSEFLVDYPSLNGTAKQMGDVSWIRDEWQSAVVELRVLDVNIFD